MQRVVVVSHEPWHRSNLPGFHVVAYSAIAVTQSANARGYRGRQHSLYYCDFAQEWQFAWYELGFMWHAFMSPSDRSYFPIAIPPGNEAAGALGKTSSPFQLALAFQELRVGETDSFNDKWMGYLAQASLQELTEATEQPEPGQQIRGPSR